MNVTAITFDVDWAPAWCVDACLEACRSRGVPATVFVTHRIETIASAQADADIELGIHPNFLPGSTHGQSEREALDHCLSLVPEARSVRTHGLWQSSRLFWMIADEFPSIDTDVSLFLPNHPGLCGTDLYTGDSGRRLVRLPYFWEDDVTALHPRRSWDPPMQRGHGLQIFDFHPIHVALNTDTMDRYRAFMRQLNGRPLSAATANDVAPYVNRGAGAATFLRSLIESRNSAEFVTIGEATARHKEADS